MFDPQDFNVLMYWPHVFLGIGSVLFGLIAIFSTKGSKLHKLFGKLFAISMLVAAFSALYFMSVRYNEPATISAITTIYGIGAGVLALRARTGILKILERLIFLIPIGMVLFQGMIFVSMVSSENPPPPIVLGAVIFVSAIFAFFMVSDIKFLRAKEFGRIRRYKRHAIRLALAVSETVRAPLITFAPPLFGNMTFVVYFIGPFFLVPLIYFLAMPKWIKNGQPTG